MKFNFIILVLFVMSLVCLSRIETSQLNELTNTSSQQMDLLLFQQQKVVKNTTEDSFFGKSLNFLADVIKYGESFFYKPKLNSGQVSSEPPQLRLRKQIPPSFDTSICVWKICSRPLNKRRKLKYDQKMAEMRKDEIEKYES